MFFPLSVLASLLLSVLPSAPSPASPLLSYLRVGPYRIAFSSDTLRGNDRQRVLEWTSFADVQRMLGRAEPITTGDASTSLTSVCYRLNGGDAPALILESDEMAGGVSVDGFSIGDTGWRPDREHHCPSLSVPAKDLVTNTGIRLGLTRQEIDRRLGMTGRDTAGFVMYERDTPKIETRGDGAKQETTQSSGFEMHFRAGRLIRFKGWRVDVS